eukprot:CAMPEP_0185723172 /NCGR_PEP_ID=MMETSP1171-20130828/104_1 /TAXON_ID=374046 /ORGANISM="Helicotheca tamensis, Strain CCMP826" /LENGTH=347 /DNA_ID=CAMNT_0028390839 /DNA_START=7 /DNA_END=1050 /DNA_ORIENTATION=+
MTNTSLYDFFVEWRQRSNPWRESYNEGGGVFERSFLFSTVVFILLNEFGKSIGRRYGKPFSSRPGFIAGTLHCASTSAITIYLLLFQSGTLEDGNMKAGDFKVWQEVGLPLSIGYFVVDIFWYCFPKGDILMLVHHIIMCFCHYPVGHDAGAILAGAGDKHWVIWLSIVGYTSEVATVLMNYRWYLLQTLKEDWIGFALVNISIVISWAARVVLFSYLLIFEIGPRASDYMEAKQLLSYTFVVVGHFVIGVLSLYWLGLMCRGGIRGLIVFKKPKPTHDGSFTFGNDIGHEEDKNELSTKPMKDEAGGATKNAVSRRSPRATIAEESQAWVAGTLYDETIQTKKKSL